MNNDKHNYSFSGADARIFTYFTDAPQLIRELGSVHTISISVHEAKGQARALGHRGIKGLARGVRTIAGSIILTVINDHPLRSVYDQLLEGGSESQLGWSMDKSLVGTGSMVDSYSLNTRMPTLLPPFNIGIQYVHEMASVGTVIGKYNRDILYSEDVQRVSGAGLLLSEVEFLDDGLVTSTNDIVTEITLSFIACDYKPLSAFDASTIQRHQTHPPRRHAQEIQREMRILEKPEGSPSIDYNAEEEKRLQEAFSDYIGIDRVRQHESTAIPLS